MKYLFLVLLLVPTGAIADIRQLCVDQQCITVELAQTPQHLTKGLMGRELLVDGHGMLFVFEKTDFHHFWMKNMKFSLDMLWLDEDFNIVDIARDVKPCSSDDCPSIKPTNQAKYVLEINAGETSKMGLMLNQRFSVHKD